LENSGSSFHCSYIHLLILATYLGALVLLTPSIVRYVMTIIPETRLAH